jgi:hypothetical protein
LNASVTEEITLSQAPVALAPAALILGACALLLSSRLRAAQRAIAVGAPLLAAVLLLASAGRALTGGVVLSHASRLFRVGSLDATLGFAVDQMSALVALVALVLVATSSFDLARRQDRPREIAALLVAGAGALFALLAEGFPTLLFGLGIAYLSSTLASSGQGRAPCRAAGVAAPSFGAAIVFASAAIALTFWSLGGPLARRHALPVGLPGSLRRASAQGGPRSEARSRRPSRAARSRSSATLGRASTSASRTSPSSRGPRSSARRPS